MVRFKLVMLNVSTKIFVNFKTDKEMLFLMKSPTTKYWED